jgi:hypothetical protein
VSQMRYVWGDDRVQLAPLQVILKRMSRNGALKTPSNARGHVQVKSIL